MARTLETRHGPVHYRRIEAPYRKGQEPPPAGLELWSPVESAGAFDLFAKTGRQLEIPGLTAPMHLSNPVCSSKLWVAGSDEPGIERLLREGGAEIESALRLGVSEIEHDGQRLILRWLSYHGSQEQPERLPFLDEAGEVLAKLGRLLPRLFPQREPVASGYLRARQRFASPRLLVWFFVLTLLSPIFLAAGSMAYEPLDWRDWVRGAVPAMLGVWFLILGYIGVLARRYHLTWPQIKLAFFFSCLLGFPYGWTLYTVSNAVLDTGPAKDYRLEVTQHWTSRGRSSTFYHAGAPAPDGPGVVSKQVTYWEYQDLLRGVPAYLTARLHRGFWGARWASRTRFHWRAEDLPEPERSIEEAYRWGERLRRPYDAASSKLVASDRDFLVRYLHLIDVAVNVRVKSTTALRGQHTDFRPLLDYATLIEKLIALPTPARFAPSKEHTIRALRLQADFLRNWKVDGKLDPYLQKPAIDPALPEASKELRAAYQSLLDNTIGETETNRAAMRYYFTGLDFP